MNTKWKIISLCNRVPIKKPSNNFCENLQHLAWIPSENRTLLLDMNHNNKFSRQIQFDCSHHLHKISHDIHRWTDREYKGDEHMVP
jgi:hypothetical protein